MDCFRRSREHQVCGRCGMAITEPRRHMYLIFGAVWWFCGPECFTEFARHLCLETN